MAGRPLPIEALNNGTRAIRRASSSSSSTSLSCSVSIPTRVVGQRRWQGKGEALNLIRKALQGKAVDLSCLSRKNCVRMNNEDRLQSVAGAHDQWRECVCKNIGNNFGLGMEEHAWDCYGIRLWSRPL